MVENAARQGERFLAQLRAIKSPAVREVRGRGLMLAVELHPEAGGARRYCERLRDAGLLAKDTHEHTIRIAPPLVIRPSEIDWASEAFARALDG
jgi:ornithine--oxo-acid transaminase